MLNKIDFPNLTRRNYVKTSERTPRYNCIAHAVGDFSRWWWPHRSYYWPSQCPLTASIDAFGMMFSCLHYSECQNDEVEHGYEKVALYALNGGPTHAARQKSNGKWSSKIGRNIDIEHALEALDGPLYGKVVKYYKRKSSR